MLGERIVTGKKNKRKKRQKTAQKYRNTIVQLIKQPGSPSFRSRVEGRGREPLSIALMKG